MTKSQLSLGFVGLGALGLPMAINLDKAGFPLRVHTRSRKAETNPELEGATPCSSPAEASTGVDVLLLCVSDDAAVEEVLFGANGAASKLGIGSVVLDCSTSDVTGRSSCTALAASRAMPRSLRCRLSLKPRG